MTPTYPVQSSNIIKWLRTIKGHLSLSIEEAYVSNSGQIRADDDEDSYHRPDKLIFYYTWYVNKLKINYVWQY